MDFPVRLLIAGMCPEDIGQGLVVVSLLPEKGGHIVDGIERPGVVFSEGLLTAVNCPLVP